MADVPAILPPSLILPAETLFGRGAIRDLLPKGARFGQRGVLVHGRSLAAADALAGVLARAPTGMEVLPFQHHGDEPTLDEVSALIAVARAHRAEWVAGVGGGSVLDLAKAAAALFHAASPPAAYHDGAAIEWPGIAFLAAPTTAGTGSETTINAVLTNPATGAKKSIRDTGMMARLVILDPDLLRTCPRPVVAASGLDALTQAIESFTSRKATWLSDQLALQGLTLIAAHLEAAHADPGGNAAEAMLTGSFLTGVALSFARLGVVHGIAHPLGSLYHVPHGLVCAACLPHSIELNRAAFGGKYDIMSQAVGGDLAGRVRTLTRAVGIASPFAGQALREKETLIAETLASGSTHANPKAITRADVEWLLSRLFA
jgi:alcohol dehydrogenase class IV